MAKYYRPKDAPAEFHAHSLAGKTLKEQRAFEKGLWEKTKKVGGTDSRHCPTIIKLTFNTLVYGHLRRYYSLWLASRRLQTCHGYHRIRYGQRRWKRTHAQLGAVRILRCTAGAAERAGWTTSGAWELWLGDVMFGRDNWWWVCPPPFYVCLLFNVFSALSIIVETDSVTIASRVSRPRADPTEIVINEQTLMNAYQTVKEKMQQRIQQL